MLLFLAIQGKPLSAYANSVDSVLHVLDHEIAWSETRYIQPKLSVIANLRRDAGSTSDPQKQFDAYKSLFDEYLTFQYDSAYHYARLMEKLATRMDNDLLLTRAHAALLGCLSKAGFFNEGMKIVDKTDPLILPPDERIDFYFSAASLLHNMEQFAGMSSDISEIYRKTRNAYYDSIVSTASPHTYSYDLAMLEKQRMLDASDPRAFDGSRRLIDTYNLTGQQKAKSYTIMAQSYAYQNNIDSATYYFALSAINDIRSCIRETTATRQLATLMLHTGDIERASQYINVASADAKAYNTRTRLSEISFIMPAIEAARHNKISSQRSLLIASSSIFGLMLAIVLVLLVKIRKKNRSLTESHSEINIKNYELGRANLILEELNIKLKEANEIKDQYIIESLKNKTVFASEVEEKVRKAILKLNGKKYAEVETLLEDMGAREELARNHASFDTAFLRLFPNFIDEFNSLLEPDARIQLNSDMQMPTELRIFALMRLGFNSSSQIAQYLGVSVNTVYVYKAKIKSRALIEKQDFEARVMAIPKT